MQKIVRFLYQLAVWRDCHGQDMVEFALLAGVVAVASGLFLPGLSDSIDTIYSRISSKLIEAGG